MHGVCVFKRVKELPFDILRRRIHIRNVCSATLTKTEFRLLRNHLIFPPRVKFALEMVGYAIIVCAEN